MKTEQELRYLATLVEFSEDAVIDRIATGEFELGEQYDALLLKAGDRTASRPRERRAACEALTHDDRDARMEKQYHGEPDAVYATS